MRLRITVKDVDTDQFLPCRLSFRGEGLPPMWGKDAAGQDMVYQGPPRLWCDGQWSGELPDLPVSLIVARPYEYATEVVQIQPVASQSIDVRLQRRCHLPAAGLQGEKD